MSEIKAGVIVKTRFCEAGSSVFGEYIEYIDREDAKRNEMLSEYNLYNDYMDNPEKTTGIFTKDKTKLSNQDKKDLKNTFRIAQDNGSLMWQTVISFDNRWLEEHGLYDSKTNILDERKIKEVATGAINRMLKNESLENATWSAAIHYNTDNIHVHVATVEPAPCRQKKMYQVYDEKIVNGNKVKVPVRTPSGELYKREEYNGRFKGKSIEACKRFVVNEIMQQREQNIEINQFIRETIVSQKKEHILSVDADLKDMFLDIYKCLPRSGNRGLWNYNNNAMYDIRPMLDKLSQAYIDKYYRDDYLKFIAELERTAKDYKTAYGKSGRDYKDGKIKDLYSRLGNQILKEMKEYDIKTGGAEYVPEDVEKIMDRFFEAEVDAADNTFPDADEVIEEPEIDDLDFDVSDAIFKWSENFKKAKVLIYGKDKDVQKGIELLELEIMQKNILAYYELGNIYQHGIGVKIDNEKAHYYYERALKGFESVIEHPEEQTNFIINYSLYRAGKHYLYGLGTEKNEEKAFEYLDESANAGNVFAAYIVGNMYWDGNSVVEKDKKIAVDYYKLADGNPYAHYKLGYAYENGIEVEKDMDRANKEYKAAYDKFFSMEFKSPDANIEYRLGKMNMEGKGVSVDLNTAEEYFELSSKNGNPNAQYQYAKILLQKGDIENADKAVEILKEAAENESVMAQYQLGKIYLKDERLKNESLAIKYLTMAAEQNNSYAQYQLGKIYFDKTSSYYDIGKAIENFEKASDQDNSYAQYQLGKIYAGKNTEYHNAEKAIHYFELAAQDENKAALYQLGKIYADKTEKVYDPKKAVMYLEPIAKEGNVYAQYKLGKLFIEKESSIYNPEKAIEYYKMASEQGNDFADVALGFIYYHGNGVKEDRVIALDYFKKAADAGNDTGKKMVSKIEEKILKPYQKKGKHLPMLFRNKAAYDVERALRKLERALDDTLQKEQIIRKHERFLEQERREKERDEKENSLEEKDN